MSYDVHYDDGDSNWIISYADMMTLLFSFFVLLSVFSTPNSAKMEKLRETASRSLGVKYEDPYGKLSESLRNVLRDFKLDKDVDLTTTTEGIEIVSKGTLFFDSGSVELLPVARDLVERIAKVLTTEARGFHVVVEGHSDDNPIACPRFPSNWELSSNRASTVVRLLETQGVRHENLRPVGLADTQPIVPNRDVAGMPIAENQARNRRVVIRIQRALY
jgi:chemotaxis protein MotB